jgi:hypothetical protein
VALVGRRGSQTADHATGTIRTALLLIDAPEEPVVAWLVRRELQYVGGVSVRRSLMLRLSPTEVLDRVQVSCSLLVTSKFTLCRFVL